MARLLYALSGQGRGHASRVRAMAGALRARGHTVRLACGGDNANRFEADGEPVLRLPTLEQVIRRNGVSMTRTFARNLPRVLSAPLTIDRIERALKDWQPDAVVTDFEPFVPRAARRLDIPVVSVDHQHLLTHTDWQADLTASPNARFIRFVIEAMIPDADATVVTSFFFPPATRNATFVAPILADDVLRLKPTQDGPLLVYVNSSDGMEEMTRALDTLDVPVVAYGLPHLDGSRVVHRTPSRPGFLADLEHARGVVCTAGFTLLAECRHLGKPVLAMPNGGVFEQTLNAVHAHRQGWAHVAKGSVPNTNELSAFLDFAASPQRRDINARTGTHDAVHAVERLLPHSTLLPDRIARPPATSHVANPLYAPLTVAAA